MTRMPAANICARRRSHAACAKDASRATPARTRNFVTRRRTRRFICARFWIRSGSDGAARDFCKIFYQVTLRAEFFARTKIHLRGNGVTRDSAKTFPMRKPKPRQSHAKKTCATRRGFPRNLRRYFARPRCRSLAMSSCPWRFASCSGVTPQRSLTSTCTPLETKCSTTANCPSATARCSGVRPS